MRNTKILNRLFIFVATCIVVLSSCWQTQVANQFNNRPEPDYSYAVNPAFSTSKEALEDKIKDLYEAEEVRFSIAKFHGYDNETLEQINEDFWVNVVVFNSATIDVYDQTVLFSEGRRIAELTMAELVNHASYHKVRVTMIKRWEEDGQFRQVNHPETFAYPSLERWTSDAN